MHEVMSGEKVDGVKKKKERTNEVSLAKFSPVVSDDLGTVVMRSCNCAT